MALRKLCVRAMNNFARTQIPGNALKPLASSCNLIAGESYLVQARNLLGKRGLQTGIGNICESLSNEDDTTPKETSGTLPDTEKHCNDFESTRDSEMAITKSIVESKSVEFNSVSNMKVSERHNLAMVYTCKVCETRSVKTMSRESYEKGIVIVRCGGCNNLHLIADRLGWFGEPSSVEDFLCARGEEIRRGVQDSYELTLEDLAGWNPK
uniref:DNL-type domain-containing protein n=1 Tax=Araucaria cunninghamii TaxID=56994 RepID=A0A0D6R655_ARACU